MTESENIAGDQRSPRAIYEDLATDEYFEIMDLLPDPDREEPITLEERTFFNGTIRQKLPNLTDLAIIHLSFCEDLSYNELLRRLREKEEITTEDLFFAATIYFGKIEETGTLSKGRRNLFESLMPRLNKAIASAPSEQVTKIIEWAATHRFLREHHILETMLAQREDFNELAERVLETEICCHDEISFESMRARVKKIKEQPVKKFTLNGYKFSD